MGLPSTASRTMRGLGTWGAARIIERVLRISPRVRVAITKSLRRTRAVATTTSVAPP